MTEEHPPMSCDQVSHFISRAAEICSDGAFLKQREFYLKRLLSEVTKFRFDDTSKPLADAIANLIEVVRVLEKKWSENLNALSVVRTMYELKKDKAPIAPNPHPDETSDEA